MVVLPSRPKARLKREKEREIECALKGIAQMFSTADHRYMAHALQLAERGLYTTDPNPRVGALLVKAGRVVAEGWHCYAGEAHAEVMALAAAGEQARGATAYVTLEPCCHHGRTAPCGEALVKAGISRVVAAMVDPNPAMAGQGLAALRAKGVAVESGLMAAEAARLNPGFISRWQRGRPYLRCKMAMSLDGRTAMRSGESRWITSPEAREDVHRLRARSSAIVTGIGTVLEDDPALNARTERAQIQPLRVVLDGGLRMPPEAAMLTLPGTTLLLTASSDSDAAAELSRAGAEVVNIPTLANRLDLNAVMAELTAREVNEVLVESGPTLAGAFMAAGLIDELVIYMAPHLMGASATGLFHLPGVEQMAQRLKVKIEDIRAVGEDWRITARPQIEV